MFNHLTGCVTLHARGRAIHLFSGSKSVLYTHVSDHTARSASIINHDANLQLRALASGRALWHLALLGDDAELQTRLAHPSQHRSCSL